LLNHAPELTANGSGHTRRERQRPSSWAGIRTPAETDLAPRRGIPGVWPSETLPHPIFSSIGIGNIKS
jgi:hypothetical protein